MLKVFAQFDCEWKKEYFCNVVSRSKMKKFIWGCIILCIMASCNGKKTKVNPFEVLAEQIDSVKAAADSIPVDTVQKKVVEEVVPATADESFADFFYNFASDADFQKSRIVFPLSSYNGKSVTRISPEDWQYDPMFSKLPVYTILFDKEEDLEVEKEDHVKSVQVEWIYFRERRLKRYYFERKKDSWFLEAINVQVMKPATETPEDFYTFYGKFVTDSLFQHERLKKPLSFVTPDPDDEFQILETVLDEGQWFAFRPPLLKDFLTNVRYGQADVPASRTKVIEVKGFGNGFNNMLCFERADGIWKLVRFEDLSD